jgi:hypothetical protein
VAGLDVALVNLNGRADELTLQYLGAAVLLTWKELPADVRESLLREAGKITGLSPTAHLQENVKRAAAGGSA